jgi:MOSC domain-containing protein
MRSFAELEALFQAGPPLEAGDGGLRLIVVRRDEGVHETPGTVRLDVALGMDGDRWSRGATRNPESQVTLMNSRVAALVAEDDASRIGDNLLVDLDLSTGALPIGARVRLGGAVIEITPKPHTGCSKFAARFGQDALRWVNWAAHRDRRLRGIHGRVVEGGVVTLGDRLELLG